LGKSVADFAGSISEKPTGGGTFNDVYSVALLGFKMVVFSDIKKTEIMEGPFTPNFSKIRQ
jgi:hypothetical protein